MIIWLASYPKSGNTWMRTFLTNYWRDAAEPVDINSLEGGPIASARRVFDDAVGVEASDLTPAEIERLRAVLEAANLPVAPPVVGSQAMLDAMGMDKKVLDKKLRFVVLERMGHAVVTSDYDRSLLDEVLEAANA